MIMTMSVHGLICVMNKFVRALEINVKQSFIIIYITAMHLLKRHEQKKKNPRSIDGDSR